jgi:hypothetical protein
MEELVQHLSFPVSFFFLPLFFLLKAQALKVKLRVPAAAAAGSPAQGGADTAAAAPPNADDLNTVFGQCKQLLHEVLRAKTNKRKIAEAFLKLPTTTELPGYYSVITNPLAINTVADRINAFAYKVAEKGEKVNQERKRRITGLCQKCVFILALPIFISFLPPFSSRKTFRSHWTSACRTFRLCLTTPSSSTARAR